MEAGDIVYYKDWDENLIVLGESQSKKRCLQMSYI